MNTLIKLIKLLIGLGISILIVFIGLIIFKKINLSTTLNSIPNIHFSPHNIDIHVDRGAIISEDNKISFNTEEDCTGTIIYSQNHEWMPGQNCNTVYNNLVNSNHIPVTDAKTQCLQAQGCALKGMYGNNFTGYLNTTYPDSTSSFTDSCQNKFDNLMENSDYTEQQASSEVLTQLPIENNFCNIPDDTITCTGNLPNPNDDQYSHILGNNDCQNIYKYLKLKDGQQIANGWCKNQTNNQCTLNNIPRNCHGFIPDNTYNENKWIGNFSCQSMYDSDNTINRPRDKCESINSACTFIDSWISSIL